MPGFFCVPRKQKKETQTVLLEKILLILCESYIPIIRGGVLSFSNSFTVYKGWEYKVSSDYKNGSIFLEITIKNKIETLVKENEEEEDCGVCTNPIKERIKCCNQPVCLECLKEIKKRSQKQEMDFCCPMCRKDLDDSVTNYTFDRYFLDKLSEAGENEKEKIQLIEHIVK